MNELLEKISSYNIFNYLLPGIVFALIGSYWTGYIFIIDNTILGMFVYYFYGLVISRIGSLIISPILRKLKLVNFTTYKRYVKASKKDNVIELLSETNNMYRTIISLFVCLMCLKIHTIIQTKINWYNALSPVIIMFLMVILFIFSYRKQTDFINKRVDIFCSENEE